MGDNVNDFFDLCFSVCVVFVHLFEKVTTETKQKILNQICVCVVFLCFSVAVLSLKILSGWSCPLLQKKRVCASVLCLRCAFMLLCNQKIDLRCLPITPHKCSSIMYFCDLW